MNIEITSITVVRGSGTDSVILDTTLPNGIYPFTGTSYVKLEIAHGQGEQYCIDNFPNVPLRVVG